MLHKMLFYCIIIGMITCKVTLKNLQSKCKKLEKQGKYATSVMLNKLAVDVAAAEKREMIQTLDHPTPWTQKAFQGGGKYPFSGTKASKYKLVAQVRAKRVQEAYLSYQVHGGTRAPNKQAIPIAVGQKRNKYGNIPRGSIKRNINNAKSFSGVPKGRTTPGVYKRMGTKRKPKLRLMIKWNEDSVSYSKRFDFYGTAREIVKRNKTKRFREAVREALK